MMHTLKSKITLFSGIVVLLTMSTVVFIVYKNSTDFFLSAVKKNITNETRLIANDLHNALVKVANDVTLLSRTPPVAGIIRSTLNKGRDVTEASTLAQWQGRLASIFEAMLKVNPYYTQIRYIGVANKGREIVRVNRTKGEIYTTDISALQNKAQASYFKEAIKLTRGSVMFSKINYNKEQGKVTYPLQPTIRVMAPIYTDKQRLFGVIVVNVNIENYVSSIFLRNTIDYNMTLLSAYGDSLIYNAAAKDVSFRPATEQALVKKASRHTGFVVTQNIFADKFKNNRIFTLSLEIPQSKINVAEQGFISQLIAWLLIIAAIATSLIYAYCSSVMSQLSDMATRITATIKTSSNELQLPVHLNDEVGMLARAFSEKTKMLDNLASFDSLTGLPNRKKIVDRLNEAILRSKRKSQLCACIYIDLNKFKQVNDTYGHDYGDELLIHFSTALQSTTRETDFCGRLGGDEFIVILEDISSDSELNAALERYQRALNITVQIRGITLTNQISGGVAIYPDDGTTSGELLMHADIAMFESKKDCQGGIHRYLASR